MPDSNPSDALDEKHERIRRERLEGITRWVEYIREQPPEVWGLQQNRLVNSQLESARGTDVPVDHERRVRSFGAEAAAEFGDESDSR